ncbi:MAG: transcriptional antiterminator [Idiomarina sp.]|nr:MAG: transcriptional antiterminator [Idiomarina sp.]
MPLPRNYVEAIYNDPKVRRYRGNPLIEALPPVLQTKALRNQLIGEVHFDPADCFKDSHLRVHEISSLLDGFFQPLAMHRQLEERISLMIRAGYVGRNPADGSLNKKMQEGYLRAMEGDNTGDRFSQSNSTARCISLIGCSGSGKSTTVNRILATYPAVIYHPNYNFLQIPYLRIECPSDGSLKSLCFNFFREVDRTLQQNTYQSKYAHCGPSELLSLMGALSTQLAVGVLVIDEVQRLKPKRERKIEMLEFFVELVNSVGVPVVLIGTPKARPIFELELQAGRRASGFGSLFWEPMENKTGLIDPVTGKRRLSEWEAFTNKLWKYQWLKQRDELLSDELRECWYDLSQGVLDIVVKLFVLAQLRAIATGLERITPSLMRRVYDQELIPVHPMLEALRRDDVEKIIKYSDLILPSVDKRILELNAQIAREQEDKTKAVSFGNNEKALRLYHMLVAVGCDSELLPKLIEKVFEEHPALELKELMKIVLTWSLELPEDKPKKPSIKSIKESEWHTLKSEDLRFKFSQKQGSFYQELQLEEELFDMEARLKRVS